MSNTFRTQYRKLSLDEIKLLEELKRHAEIYEGIIVGFVPEGRERSLAMTKLEECVMWATKGLTK
jgi:hypothetical protein